MLPHAAASSRCRRRHCCQVAMDGSTAPPTGGLFVSDYTDLPTPTSDMALAKEQMDTFGYCILKDMLSLQQRCVFATRKSV